jgi:hypothetical protein
MRYHCVGIAAMGTGRDGSVAVNCNQRPVRPDGSVVLCVLVNVKENVYGQNSGREA